MKWEVIPIILLLIAYLPGGYSQGNGGEITLKSDLQILEFGNIYGGHITWIIKGEIARELREAIGNWYHVSSIDLARASQYFVNRLEHVVENNEYGCGYLSFVRLYRSDPLHGKTNGILNSPDDVEGLIGDINSTSTITIRMLIRGEPVNNRNVEMIPRNIFFAPFYALSHNESDFQQKFNLKNVELKSEHYEIMAGLGSIEHLSPGTLHLRLVLGEFFITGSKNEVVSHVSFDPIESPLLLFILFLVAWYLFKFIERDLGDKYSDTAGPITRKRMRNAIRGEALGLFILYLFNLFAGWVYIVILGGGILFTYFLVRKYYSGR